MKTPSDLETIPVPHGGLALRRIATSGVPVNWGRDQEGRFLLLVELKGNQIEVVRRHRVSVTGISVDFREIESGQALLLILEREADKDLFFGLCQTLIAKLSEVPESATAVLVTLEHVKRWMAFLAGKQKRVLSHEEILGLVGELSFLSELLVNGYEEQLSVESWLGPDGGQHDFLINGISVEVKALGGRDRQQIRVSSEDQLDSVLGKLFLRVYGISVDEVDGKCLNEIAKELGDVFTSETAQSLYYDKLARAGYVELLDYDAPKMSVARHQTYEVRDGFPRLARSSLPPGLRDVRYSVDIAAITGFLHVNPDLMEILHG